MSYLVLSDLHGDRPRPLPKIKELQGATDITDRKGSPSWDYDVCTHVLSSVIISILSHDWMTDLYLILTGERRLEVGEACTDQPEACQIRGSWNWQGNQAKPKACSFVCDWQAVERWIFRSLMFCCNLLYWLKRELECIPSRSLNSCFCLSVYAEFGCSICRKVIQEPLTTPCGHNFCKTCLLGAFDSQSIRERSRGGRTLRAQKIVKKCPSCPTDICDFLENPQVRLNTSLLKHAVASKHVFADASWDFSYRSTERWWIW